MAVGFIDERDQILIEAIQDGFPLTLRPFADIGAAIGWREEEVIAGLANLRDLGIIKRFGLIVRHHELGFRANAMVVWDAPDDRVSEIGARLQTFSFITLCYRRKRNLPDWPYNLYCMIHGRQRDEVLAQVERLSTECGLGEYPRQVLFSGRRFKQRGAKYGTGRPVSRAVR